jgi:crotonobetainyl-CoA:carnitine CoA-transferase CaiB-like acyl-CoA transferase
VRPLEGVRVVELAHVAAGPFAGMLLADLGADVVKIEPPGGDLSRRAFPDHDGMSGYYAQQNAGKRNVSIDLNVPGARDVAVALVERADVVVENFRPGTLASFGLGYDDVAAINPGVVYVSISGYGQHGAWRSRSAYAPTVQAETGMTATTADQFGLGFADAGDDDRRPRSDSLSHADVYSGLHAAIAVLAALHRRSVTGRGEYIDVAMAAVMLSVNERVHADLSEVELGAEVPVLGATDCPFFVSPEGDVIVSPMSLVGTLSFPFYLAAMRRPDLADDPRFATPAARVAHRGELHAIVQEWISTFADTASLDAQLDEAKIAIGRVRTMAEIADSDWAAEWGAIRTVPDRAGGEIRVPGRPWHFAGDDGAEEKHSPARQGEDNAAVLAKLGYSPETIAELAARGALVDPGGASS